MTPAGYALTVFALAATAALLAVPAAAARRWHRRRRDTAIRAWHAAARPLTDQECDRILRMLRT